MRIGYVMNTYPVTSATFIRREIAALEALGVEVTRFAIRPWDQPLVEAADRDEAARCRYLLAPGALPLGLRLVREILGNPAGVARAVATGWQMWRAAERGAAVRHLAYLLEAVHLKQSAGGIAHLHAHFSTNTAAVALLVSRLGGPGYSFTAHGPDEFRDPRAASLALKIAQARFVVAISAFARVQLALAGGMAQWPKLHVVRCGVDLDMMQPAPAPAADAPLVCIGRLCPQKAQTLLVEAWGALHKSHPQARLILIGDGETRPEIEQAIARHGLCEVIEIRGWAENAAVQDALATSRALVLPSFAEGLPIVIMEAHAHARPVISTFIAAIPELVDAQSGWLVPAGDVPALTAALRSCLDATPEDLARRGATGRSRVEAAHDLHASARALKVLFAAVTDPH